MIKTFCVAYDVDVLDKEVNEYLAELKRKHVSYKIKVTSAGTSDTVYHIVTVISKN